MRNKLGRLSIVLVLSTFLFSCGTDMEDSSDLDKLCVFTDDSLIIEPICSFDPREFINVHFPVKVLVDGVVPGYDDYEFSWSSDPDFKANQISISYARLPLTVTITELSTGCTAEVTLENDYWD